MIPPDFTNTPPVPGDAEGGNAPLPPQDELDGLLRTWHRSNADRAAAGRDRLLAALADEEKAGPRLRLAGDGTFPQRTLSIRIRRIVMNRYSALAAAAVLVAAILPFTLPRTTAPVMAQPVLNVVMAPDGGRLDAVDAEGNILGPCELKHTDVHAEVSGLFTRVTVRQQYHNPHKDKIEAVYTFPLSHRAAVDRMTMTIGDRVIVGEVKERELARQIYENAKANNRVASLLEQERPNIFTQSVANIEPDAQITIEISYVELVQQKDGEFTFDFPTVVGPRYIPGNPIQPSPGNLRNKRAVPAEGGRAAGEEELPDNLQLRRGLILTAPAANLKTEATDGGGGGAPDISKDELARVLAVATPVKDPGGAARTISAVFEVAYPDGSTEKGTYSKERIGEVNGRWFYCPPAAMNVQPGAAFSPNTDQVPDASRITPMPVRPPTRAGHDISISVTIDTGGPPIDDVKSALHQIVREDQDLTPNGQPRKTTVSLNNAGEIPNKDFVLTWKQPASGIADSVFTHTGEHGNFFCITLNPPARVDDRMAVPRELVFVLDTSGSMNGFPIEKAKAVMAKAIEAMRPVDTFNMITFAGDTRILWNDPRPATEKNRREAQDFLSQPHGRGGTEMMKAINAALTVNPQSRDAAAPITPAQLADLPADGREVVVRIHDSMIESDRLEADRTQRSPILHVPGGGGRLDPDVGLQAAARVPAEGGVRPGRRQPGALQPDLHGLVEDHQRGAVLQRALGDVRRPDLAAAGTDRDVPDRRVCRERHGDRGRDQEEPGDDAGVLVRHRQLHQPLPAGRHGPGWRG